jgi:type III restriction enzyme
MIYLDAQAEVLAYTKVLPRMPLRIPYHDVDGYLRHYRPDFVVKTADCFWLVETKGAGWDEQVNVARKAKAAEEWCDYASELTKVKWSFVKVLDTEFGRYSSLPFGQLAEAVRQN